MNPTSLLRPFAIGLALAVGVNLILDTSWAWSFGVFGIALPALLSAAACLSVGPEVLAVRADEDFGRLALLDHGHWEGAAALAGASRPVDVEIEAADDEGPSLGQRLAYQNACADLPSLLPALAAGTDLDLEAFTEQARFLRLYLPDRDRPEAPDWSLSFAVDPNGDRCFEVDVRAGQIAALRQTA